MRATRQLILALCIVFTGILAAQVERPTLTLVTSCVDPQYHFTVRNFRGVILDEKGKPVAHVNADLHRFRKIPEYSGLFEPSPDVFTSFATDEQGRFSLPNLHRGMYLVVVHPPRLYQIEQLMVKLDRHGVSGGLVARLGLTGNCNASWELSQ